MMTVEELRQLNIQISGRLEQVAEFLDIPGKEAELAALEEKMNAPDFWNDKEKAQETVAAASSCRNIISPYRKVLSDFEDFGTAIELAGEDEEFLAEADIAGLKLNAAIDKLEVVSFLSGRFDKNNFYMTIHAGAGGTESCDWGSILLRMYRRYAERRDWKEEMI
ncbi:MAG: PCRF domain-containing protein, partial [Lentisphaeria bacterium]|nr:PCRF domain-containing protein [Lentisphaeria bacterium]